MSVISTGHTELDALLGGEINICKCAKAVI
ncbi:hypothetical protein LCGC14_0689550 [marine sediment metagenome]|uniref:Uncharacterized protein n=1 Tax=marine sediment metagenome TaxID=412755 RepID=A0A0F9QQS9_9ZZZZ